VRAGLVAADGDVAPAEDRLALGPHDILEHPFELLPPPRLRREETEPDAVASGGGELERDRRAQERVGELQEDAGAVSGVGIRARGPAVLEVLERAQRAVDRLVRPMAVETGDERDAACVVLVRRVVEALLLQCPSPPMWLVRRGEGNAMPASPGVGARTKPSS
jgi:hypothetical protein